MFCILYFVLDGQSGGLLRAELLCGVNLVPPKRVEKRPSKANRNGREITELTSQIENTNKEQIGLDEDRNEEKDDGKNSPKIDSLIEKEMDVEEREVEQENENEENFVFIRLLSCVQKYVVEERKFENTDNIITQKYGNRDYNGNRDQETSSSSSSSHHTNSLPLSLPRISPHTAPLLAPSLNLLLRCHKLCHGDLKGLGLLLSAPLVRTYVHSRTYSVRAVHMYIYMYIHIGESVIFSKEIFSLSGDSLPAIGIILAVWGIFCVAKVPTQPKMSLWGKKISGKRKFLSREKISVKKI